VLLPPLDNLEEHDVPLDNQDEEGWKEDPERAMPILRNLISGTRALFRREQRNREIDEELEGYLDAAIAEKLRRGMRREDAERSARAEVGSAAVVRHRIWSAGWESIVESLAQDVRFGLRQLLKSPGFSLVAILSLALGIGANTAIFTLVNDLLLKSLPVREPQQLVSFGRAVGGGNLGSVKPGAVEMFTTTSTSGSSASIRRSRASVRWPAIRPR
jgi:hypothetical protein